MSLWGMSDGATLTGKSTWTSGDATLAGGSPAATYSTDGVEVGDVLVGADSKLYRVISIASETSLEVDRNYEGGTSSNQDVTKIELPRNVKITKDDGTGHTIASLGIFGIADAEAVAGGDDVVSIAVNNNTNSANPAGNTTSGGAGYTSAPTVTVTQPTARAFDATSTSVVVAASDAIVLGSTNLPPTGTELLYMNFPGGSLAADGTKATSGTTSGAVPSGLTNATIYFARTANSTAIHLYDTFNNATANNGIGKPSSGLTSISGVSGTAGNHCLVGRTASATASVSGGKVSAVTMAVTGSDYTSAPTITVASEEHTFNAASAVAANGEITITGHTFVVGDAVTYSDKGGTAIAELTDGGTFFIKEIATNKVYLSATNGGDKLTLTDGPSENHSLTGEQATATASLGLGGASGDGGGRKRDMQGAHLGWVKRTVGTGGRAGRVHYETLVAASSISGDAEDLATPDQ